MHRPALGRGADEDVIADTFENLPLYEGTVPHLGRVLEFIRTTDLRTLALGRHAIYGDAVYLMVQEYETVNEAARRWESHRRHLDIQLVLNGQEYIGYAPTVSLRQDGPYDPQDDVSLHSDAASCKTALLVGPDSFCVFFPQDGHRPGFHRTSSAAHVRKAVFKVLLPQT